MIAPLDPHRLALYARLTELRHKAMIDETNGGNLTATRAEELVTEMSELLGEISALVGKVEWAPEKEDK